jgi:hypothetical protein
MVITGSDKAFAAGADIGAMAGWDFMDVYKTDYISRNWDRIGRCRKPLIAAVAGFALGGTPLTTGDKALLTIVDSHVTTLITGFALFLFGTGPIKGFAVTLCLGIAINLFTALVGTKVIFDLFNQRRKIEQLSI